MSANNEFSPIIIIIIIYIYFSAMYDNFYINICR